VTGRVVRRASHVLERRFAGEVLLATQGREEVDRLEGTSAAVWQLLDEPRAFSDLTDVLASVYRASAREIEADVQTLLEGLEELGYVEIGPDA
jgi:hypothetical protein